MSATQKQKTCSEQTVQQPHVSVPMVTVSITTLHEPNPLVVQVPKGSTARIALTQAGINLQEGWEVYIDGKLASLDTPLDQDQEMFYVTRVAGGK